MYYTLLSWIEKMVENGDNIMGKTTKYIFKIVIFPITMLFCIYKLIINFVDKKITSNYLRQLDIDKIDCLDGIEFEEFLYYSFKSLGIKVTKTKSSRDYGADLLIKFKNQTIVIQTKLYFKHSVGNSAIQEIATARNYYNADSGLVITNSFFTKSACNLAESNNITLIDRNRLSDFLSSDKVEQLYIISNWCEPDAVR